MRRPSFFNGYSFFRTERVQRMKKVFDNEVILPEVARLIEQGHSVTIPVRGNSMNPFLADGRDCVTLGGFVPEELQTGVTVLAKDMEGRFVLHRIIARRDEKLRLQGDGNLRQTEETTPAQVAGKVIAVIRKGKRYAADGVLWRTYSYCWVRLAPCRWYLLALYRRL